ncbi:Ig-like domain-containing protein [Actinoplanes missouriensis]|uniref:Ig-like domain-containing protein n=1 Tax=Actinoplanes missouriensis TaxID=1866 RepID=UPI0033F99547
MRVLPISLAVTLLAGIVTVPVAAAAAPAAAQVSAGPSGDLVSPEWYARVRSVPLKVVFRGSADVVRVVVNDVTMTRVPGTAGDWSAIVPITPSTLGLFGTAYDALDNGTPFRRYLVVDDEAPEFGQVSPPAGELVHGSFMARASGMSDDTHVDRLELWANGKYVGVRKAPPLPHPGITSYGMPVDSGSYSGNLRLTWKAYDTLGNMSTRSWTVVADNAGPTATVNPKQNTRVRGTFTTWLTGVKDVAGLYNVQLWANGKYVGATTGTKFKVKTGKFNGKVKLTWRLEDDLYNVRTYTRTVIADNKAPTVKVTKAPKSKAKVKGTVKVYVKASDASGIARVELIVNGKVVAKDTKSGYVLSVNTKKQKKTMKVRVRVYDKLGNVKYAPTRVWYR